MNERRIGAAVSPLPPERPTTDAGPVTITRVWPEKPSPSTSSDAPGRARLAVEVREAGGALRAGWYHGDSGRLELFPPWTDPRLPRLAELQGPRAVVISHRPGRRAVVRCEGPGPDDVATAFVKLVRPGRAQGILDGLARASAFEGPFRMPSVLAHDESSVTFSALTGEALHATGDDDDAAGPGWSRAWEEVLGAWREAVLRPAPAADLPVHAAKDEADVLRRWAEQSMPLLRAGESGAELFVEAVESAAATLRTLPEVTPRPAHRDFHDKQVLWSAAEGPGLLDVDTACLADPALDLGNLRAHATWRHRQGVWSAVQADGVRLAVDATADELSHRLGRPTDQAVAVYEQASLLRLLCVYAFRPQYAPLAETMRAELHPGS